jgi:hypothetical protein
VKSDGTWKAQENMPFIEGSPTYFCFYGGVRHRATIRYDARNEIPGWTSASFDDSAWPAAPAGSTIVITRDARCWNDKGAADRWLSLSLSNQPFESWIRGFYPTATDPAIIGPGADHDHDGLINLEEFAFGLLPDNAKSVNPITDSLNAGTGGFSYTRRSGISFVVQTSTDLTEWKTDSGATQNPNPHEDDVKTVRVVLSPSLLVAPSLFVRVQAIPLNN